MGELVSKPAESSGCLGLLFRFYWIGLGNFPLVFLPISIVREKTGAFSLYDILLVLAGIAVMAVRYVDIAFFKGETADNKPATLLHWKKYALKVLVFVVLALGVSHGIAALLAS